MNKSTDPQRHVPLGVVGPDKLLYALDQSKSITPIIINSIDGTNRTITVFNFTTKTVQTLNTKDYRFFEIAETAVAILRT